MKHIILGSALLFSSLLAGGAQAQVVHYDSIGIDSPYGGIAGIQNIKDINEFRDGQQAHFIGTEFFTVQYKAGGATPIVFQKGAPVHVYWMKQSGDSCAGTIHFVHFPEQGPPDRTSEAFRIVEDPPNVPMMTTWTIPDTGYNAIEIDVGADTGATSFWLDAIVIVQSGTVTLVNAVASNVAAREIVLENYPNPFVASLGTNLHFDSPISGHASIVLTDLLGRGVTYVALGELSSGPQDVRIVPAHPGVYLARLRMGDGFVGAPLKITAE